MGLNLLKQKKDGSHMVHSWHIGVVKAHIHQNRDPDNNKNSTAPEEESNYSSTSKAANR